MREINHSVRHSATVPYVQSTLGYPQVILHDAVGSAGQPLVTGAATYDATVATEMARFNHWDFQPAYLWSSQRFAVNAVRALNPDMRTYAHLLLFDYWHVTDATSYQGRYESIVGADHWTLASDGSNAWWPNLHVARCRDGLIDLWSEVIDCGIFDGAFIDPVAEDNGWMVASKVINWQSSYGSLDAWNLAQRAAHSTVLNTLRSRFPSKVFFGNGGQAPTYDGTQLVNGWWRENFPNQNGGSWTSNMTVANGYINDSTRHSAPIFSVLSSVATAFNYPAKGRFVVGSACLGSGAGIAAPGDFDYTTNFRQWWNAEYGIDVSTANAVNRANGWLGQPVASYVNAGSGIFYREFDHGTVVVNPNIFSQSFTLSGTRRRVLTNQSVNSVTIGAFDAAFLIK